MLSFSYPDLYFLLYPVYIPISLLISSLLDQGTKFQFFHAPGTWNNLISGLPSLKNTGICSNGAWTLIVWPPSNS
jgi:hypothetical protein